MGSSASKPQGTADSHMHPLSAGERCQANQGAGIITAQLSAVNLKEISTGGKEIDLSRLSEWEEGVSSSASYRLARTILSKTAFQDALVRPELVPADKHIFNLKIGQPEASVTNQHASGRCWLFATCNLMRLGVIDKYNLNQDFELSQSYLCFAFVPPSSVFRPS